MNKDFFEHYRLKKPVSVSKKGPLEIGISVEPQPLVYGIISLIKYSITPRWSIGKFAGAIDLKLEIPKETTLSCFGFFEKSRTKDTVIYEYDKEIKKSLQEGFFVGDVEQAVDNILDNKDIDPNVFGSCIIRPKEDTSRLLQRVLILQYSYYYATYAQASIDLKDYAFALGISKRETIEGEPWMKEGENE